MQPTDYKRVLSGFESGVRPHMQPKVPKRNKINLTMEEITSRVQKDRNHINPYHITLKKLTQIPNAMSKPLRITLVSHKFST